MASVARPGTAYADQINAISRFRVKMEEESARFHKKEALRLGIDEEYNKKQALIKQVAIGIIFTIIISALITYMCLYYKTINHPNMSA